LRNEYGDNMVKREDFEFEKEILSTGYHIALPLEIVRDEKSGELTITSYSFCVEIAEEFERSFASDPFSSEARNFLREKISPIMNEMGYDTSYSLDRVHFEFRSTNIDRSKILPECEIIDNLSGEIWDDLPLDEFELDPDDILDRMAVIKIDGKIVCYAGINDISGDDGLIELTVECEEEYCRRGYGSSCTAAIADYYAKLGKCAKYICADENIASIRTAEAAGLALVSKTLPFVCYKMEDDADEETI